MDKSEPFFDQMLLWMDGAHPGAWNMAADQAMLEHSPLPVLRIYAWDQPTVTIGYAQNLPRLRASLPEWPVVRRWTGGGVVLHREDFTYSLIVPAAHEHGLARPVESYRRIHGALAQALRQQGHPGCRLAQPEDVVEAPFCFVAPAVHDVIMGTVKVAGAGQRRGKLGLLHQGSVQNVRLPSEFWSAWAGVLARAVTVIHAPPDAVVQRALALEQQRYATTQWLEDREDLLKGTP